MWPLTFYVESLPPNTGGCANGPVIRILNKYRNDYGIYRHELEHVKQWFYMSVVGIPIFYGLYSIGYTDIAPISVGAIGIHSLLYKLVQPYRLWSEVSAYKEQSRWYANDRRPLFASFISSNYNLSITEAEALKLLIG